MPFSNIQIEIAQLPALESIEYKGLSRQYLPISMMSTLFSWLVAALIVFLILFFGKELEVVEDFIQPNSGYIYTVLLVIATINLVITYLGYFQKGYAIREKDISYKEGLFWKSQTLVPFNRIQHSEVKQGPLERMFKLSSVYVYTAGGSTSDLSIGGLNASEADHIKQHIIMQTISEKQNIVNEEE